MSHAEAACVSTERKLVLLAVAAGFISALILIGIELCFLYEEFLVYLPAAIVESLRVMVGRL